MNAARNMRRMVLVIGKVPSVSKGSVNSNSSLTSGGCADHLVYDVASARQDQLVQVNSLSLPSATATASSTSNVTYAAIAARPKAIRSTSTAIEIR